MRAHTLTLALLLFTIPGLSHGQPQIITVNNPLNLDCESAIPICSDAFEFHFDPVGTFTSDPQRTSRADEDTECLWFRLCIPAQTTLTLTCSTIAAINTVEASCEEVMENYDCKDARPIANSITIPANDPTDIELEAGTYYLLAKIDIDQEGVVTIDLENYDGFQCCEGTETAEPCPDCLSTFSPLADSTYIINAWVSLEDLPIGTTDITGPTITIECPEGNPVSITWETANGPVIDGWQRREGRFTMPTGSPEDFIIYLGSEEGVALFDDIRVFPEHAIMKSYVYDPQNLRFVAELDERHFATLYEYDPEGRLIRVKKETVRGIMTIQEGRQMTPWNSPTVW